MPVVKKPVIRTERTISAWLTFEGGDRQQQRRNCKLDRVGAYEEEREQKERKS
jgi:hypothetical protein